MRGSFACVSIVLASLLLSAQAAKAQGGPPPNSATFLRTDTTTLGNWHAAYGADGYSVAGNGQSLPGYASFAVQNQEDFTWTSNTTDTRALQTADGSNRIAAVWYNASTFNFDLNLADGNSHQFALYALDWDASGRAETVQIVDATSQTVLDTESISSFTNGVYLVWNITGHVQVNITRTAGNNAVVNGIFFGGSSVVSSVASFVRTDTSTQGNWHGAYGADGYSIANDSQSIPSYASFAVQNQQNFTWSDPPADVRALETGNGSDRIASVWYNTPEFNFDLNLTDGNSHQFALYAVDWDNSGRAETIQILDAATDALLDTRSISNFTNGLFLVWNLKGHVKLNVIQTAGNNAVVSGVFFGANSTISSSAAFLRTDTTTQGNWHGTYGSDGYSVANDSQSVPAYASFAVQNQQDFTWSNSPTDARSLQTGSASGRIAAVWYSTPEFNFDVNFTDGNSHQFALYAVDWDSSGRAETIQILDAATDALLDTRSISNFANGLYLVWNVAGHVKVNVIQTAGNNAVISGVFFGGGSTINSTASFVRTDTTTQGSWHGTYGSDGYSIANDSQSLPSYANFAVQNQANWTWLPLTTDPRALQTGSNTGSISATWYNTPEFNLDVNLTDGQSHQLALYAMDWDSSDRAETIELLDAATGALLDSRNISSFVNGLYLVWNVSGHVKFNIILTDGNNAVVSGVFWDPVPGSGGTNPVLQSISITPTNPSTGVGAALQFTALGTYSNGQTQNLSSSATWSSSSSQVATVNASGLATSQVVGNTTISASVGSISSSTVLTVTASSPPGITASLSPAPNSAGWNNSAVTVSFTCTSGSYAVASCPAPQFVNTSGANQIVTGTVVDTAGLSASIDVTLNIEKTLPTIANVTPADQSVLTSPTGVITGSAVNSLTSVTGVRCNGASASFNSGNFSCNFSLNPGVNLVMVLATDVAGNTAGARLHLIYSAPLPAPTALQITPDSANVLIGATQQFTVVDQLGNPRTDANWTVDNTNVATISTDASPILTGVAAGTVTLTALVGNASAQIQVNILAGASLPVGTTVWTAPPIPGYTPLQILQAAPTGASTPDLIGLYQDSNSDLLIGGFTRDGQQLWQSFFSSSQLVLAQAIPDNLGGLVIFGSGSIVDIDGQTGGQVWQTSINYAGQPAAAPDGGTYIYELTTDTLPTLALVKLDAQSGQPIRLTAVPYGTENLVCNGITYPPNFAFPGVSNNPVVDSQGNVFFEFSNLTDTTTCPSTETRTETGNVMRVAPNGTVSTFPLFSYTQTCSGPGECLFGSDSIQAIVPDGQGGAFALWNQNPSGENDGGLTAPSFITNITKGATYQNPLAGDYFVPIIVLGEDGDLIESDGTTVAALGAQLGSTPWTYQPSNGVATIEAVHGGGISLFDKGWNQVSVDSRGNASSSVSLGSPQSVQVTLLGQLDGITSSGVLGQIYNSTTIDWADGGWDGPAGGAVPSQGGQKMPYAPPLPKAPLPTCGTQNPCAGDAIENAFSSLQTLITTNCSSTSSCQSFVLGKPSLNLSQQSFSSYLTLPHEFYDATRSNAKAKDVLCIKATWRNLWSPPTCPFDTDTTILEVWQADHFGAITKTPSGKGEGMVTFFDPGQVNLSLGNTAPAQKNQATIFHEALHGVTGLFDASPFPIIVSLESALGICYDQHSDVITEYIEFYIFGLGTAPTTQSNNNGGNCTLWP